MVFCSNLNELNDNIYEAIAFSTHSSSERRNMSRKSNWWHWQHWPLFSQCFFANFIDKYYVMPWMPSIKWFTIQMHREKQIKLIMMMEQVPEFETNSNSTFAISKIVGSLNQQQQQEENFLFSFNGDKIADVCSIKFRLEFYLLLYLDYF